MHANERNKNKNQTKPHHIQIDHVFYCSNNAVVSLKPCSDEIQNGFKGLKLKPCKFLKPFFMPCEYDYFCLKTLKHFHFKCLKWFFKIKLLLRFYCKKINHVFYWFSIVFLLKLKLLKQMKIIWTFPMKTASI